MKTRLVSLVLCVVSVGCAEMAFAGDFYVVTATEKSHESAQKTAANTGGWVLDTDLYPKLQPGLYSVVRGPFGGKPAADAELASLKAVAEFKDAYVADAGVSRLPAGVGSPQLSPQILAALLGELDVKVSDEAGGKNPCEPQEPYQRVQLSYMSLERSMDKSTGTPTFAPKLRPLDLGAFWVIKKTGAIVRMRACAE